MFSPTWYSNAFKSAGSTRLVWQVLRFVPSLNQRLLKSQPEAAPDARLCHSAACSCGSSPSAVATSSLLAMKTLFTGSNQAADVLLLGDPRRCTFTTTAYSAFTEFTEVHRHSCAIHTPMV